jgi:uncharacterized protein (DUF779 family)
MFETASGLLFVVMAVVHSVLETSHLVLLGDELVQTRHIVVLHQSGCCILPE